MRSHPRVVLLAALVTALTWASLVHASPPSAMHVPANVERQVRRACGAGELQVVGPWQAESDRVYAALVWRGGAENACLALIRQTANANTRVEAFGTIPAGYSTRYEEFFAPTLRAEPLRVAGNLPAPIVDATQMGAGGGGGDRTTVWMARGGHFTLAFDGVLNGASDINTATTNPCPSAAPLAVETRGGHTELRARSCFDGRYFRFRMRYDGTRFVQ